MSALITMSALPSLCCFCFISGGVMQRADRMRTSQTMLTPAHPIHQSLLEVWAAWQSWKLIQLAIIPGLTSAIAYHCSKQSLTKA